MSPKLDQSQDLDWERDLGTAMDQVNAKEQEGHVILPSGFNPTSHEAGVHQLSPPTHGAGVHHSLSPAQLTTPHVDGADRYIPKIHQQESMIFDLNRQLLNSEEQLVLRNQTSEQMVAFAERRHMESMEEHYANVASTKHAEQLWNQQQAELQLHTAAMQNELAQKQRQYVATEHAMAERLAATEQAMQSLSLQSSQ